MKKTLSTITLIAVFLCVQGFCFLEDENNASRFIGTWNWIEDIDSVQSFTIFVGERNDSLLFSFGGIFYCGNKIHGYDFDNNGNLIANVRTVVPKGNKVKSKVSEYCSNFYGDPAKANKYNPVSLELLNDTTMLFILNDNKPYWPDTAIMRRRDYINHTFSQEEDYYLYKE
ncbi:MAG: hypothetical protein IJY44_05690 [Bacteroidaceae bacterium]|nr:hypothetical protein [Bacteroidaceae bacterium]